jgi:hypothetical protein
MRTGSAGEQSRRMGITDAVGSLMANQRAPSWRTSVRPVSSAAIHLGECASDQRYLRRE